MAMHSRKAWAALIAILALALVLRTVGLRRLVYTNPDEALWSYFIVTGAQLSWLSPHPSTNALAHILSWDYGYPLFVVDDLYVRALQAVGFPVNEATLPLPLAVFGTLNCLLVFLIASRVGLCRVGLCRVGARVPTRPCGREDTPAHATLPAHATCAALVAATLMAVMPLAVGRSRSIGGAEACSGFLLLLAMLQLMRHMERPHDRRRQWLAGLCVGLYLCGDVQFVLGGAVLLGLLALWPVGSRSVTAPTPEAEGEAAAEPAGERPVDVGWRERLRLLWRPGVLLPPLVLFAPYVPAWLYAIHLGYRNQTYLGTVLAEHKADWGFHLLPFGRDLAQNLGVFPFLALPVLLWYFARHWRRPQQWLLLWIGVTALPFIFAITSTVTEASGYHEHLAAALAIALGLALSALSRPLEGPAISRPVVGCSKGAGRLVAGPSNGTARGLAAAMRAVTALVIVATLLVTLGGVFRVTPLVPLWPATKIPYGGLVPNSGMKAAGWWVRQSLPPDAPVFAAHDPAVAYWYMGRECVTGGLVPTPQRKQALLANAPRLAAAVIPGQFAAYPPDFMRQLGFTGRICVLEGGVERLNIYTRTGTQVTLTTEATDPLYNAAIRTPLAIIPPGWPYAPGKPVNAGP
ncbi:hypothetical protein LLH23_20675 [bacterium]|nr:hypothetical protein [bacterium]